MKKTLTVLGIAVALTFTAASAATADDGYVVPPPTCSVSPASVPVGETAVVTCDFDDSFEGRTVSFGLTGAGVGGDTLATVRFTGPAGTATVDKVVTESQVSTMFTAPAAGSYTVDLFYGDVESMVVPVDVTVTAASGGAESLPVTGGTVPTDAIWIGAGALGLGAIAVVAAVVRRRSHARH